MDNQEMTEFDAVSVGSQTLVGSMGDFPRNFGNCFGLVDEDGVEHSVVNFICENLEELLKREVISWPVRALNIGGRFAVVHDHRIPDNWYQDHFCEVCTPVDMLPLIQRMKHLRDIASGVRKETEVDFNGKKMTIVSQEVKAKSRKLRVMWAPYIPVVRAVHNIDAESELDLTDGDQDGLYDRSRIDLDDSGNPEPE